MGKIKHGLRWHPIYKSWQDMKSRCDNPNNWAYKDYGGRGISYDKKWSNFISFYEDMGSSYQLGLELDRYPDKNGNYSKENCRWATDNQQCRNKRNNVFLTIGGETKLMIEWADENGIRLKTLRARYFHYGYREKEKLLFKGSLKRYTPNT